MTAKEIIELIYPKLPAILIILFGLIEFTPIKISPLSSILGWLGKMICKDTNLKIESLDKSITILDERFVGISNELQDHIIQSQRSAILNFANECRRDTKHTKEEFDYILKLHDSYELYLKEKHVLNGQVTCAYNYIIEIYNKCYREGTFL